MSITLQKRDFQKNNVNGLGNNNKNNEKINESNKEGNLFYNNPNNDAKNQSVYNSTFNNKNYNSEKNTTMNRDFRGRHNRSASIDQIDDKTNNDNYSMPKDLNNSRPLNHCISTEKNRTQSKDAINKIEQQKKSPPQNGLKIPLNMTNIHSFNINVITQTVSNQVNSFLNSAGQNPNNPNNNDTNQINANNNNNNNNINTAKKQQPKTKNIQNPTSLNGSSENLVNLSQNNNSNNHFVNANSNINIMTNNNFISMNANSNHMSNLNNTSLHKKRK